MCFVGWVGGGTLGAPLGTYISLFWVDECSAQNAQDWSEGARAMYGSVGASTGPGRSSPIPISGPAPAPACPSAALEWPTDEGVVTSPFNPGRLHPVLKVVRPHNGLDIGAPTGTPVYPIHFGAVSMAGNGGWTGNRVDVGHYGGWYSSYFHLDSITVSTGAFVTPYTQIGTVGSTGLSTGPHLHLEVRSPDGTPMDPQQCF